MTFILITPYKYHSTTILCYAGGTPWPNECLSSSADWYWHWCPAGVCSELEFMGDDHFTADRWSGSTETSRVRRLGFAVRQDRVVCSISFSVELKLTLVHSLKAALIYNIQSCHFFSRSEPFVRWLTSAFLTSKRLKVANLCYSQWCSKALERPWFSTQTEELKDPARGSDSFKQFLKTILFSFY